MRTSRSLAAAAVLGLLFVPGAVASAAAQTVDEIIAKNLEAKGGVARLKATQSVRTTGRAKVQGQDARIVTSSKRPYFALNQIELGGRTMRQGFDGQTMWMSVDGMPAQALPPGPQTEIMKQTSQIDSPLLGYKEKGTKITLEGTESEGQRKLHHLVITPKVGPVMHYYIDAASGLESKIVVTADEGGQDMTMEMRLSDYKAVDGRMMPFTIRQYVNGNQVGEVIFEKVEFNVPIEDAFFRMPK